jgi:hypothetical protein
VVELADTAARAATAELAALRLVAAIVAMQEAVAAALAETVELLHTVGVAAEAARAYMDRVPTELKSLLAALTVWAAARAEVVVHLVPVANR